MAAAACSAAPPLAEPPPAATEPVIAAPAPPVDPAPAPGPTPTETGPAPRLALPAACRGHFRQGGLVICKGAAGDTFRFNDLALTADDTGTVQFGLARGAPASLTIAAGDETLTREIAPRNDESRTVPGLDCDKVDARTPEQKAHAAASWEKKQASFTALKPGRGALDGFRAPSLSPSSSPFGPERRYTGISKTSGQPCDSTSIHYGLDFAAPVGTDVFAPAAGVVTLADPDLYYEGGAVFIDHGHGLLSVFMHLSEVTVANGDVVAPGQRIAKSGNTGRSSGPHLHWGVKWRNPASTDRGGDYYIDPALLLTLPGPAP
jgi:murein DD-endopeptidase MepM/ murein hydrolase activator NlpD